MIKMEKIKSKTEQEKEELKYNLFTSLKHICDVNSDLMYTNFGEITEIKINKRYLDFMKEEGLIKDNKLLGIKVK